MSAIAMALVCAWAIAWIVSPDDGLIRIAVRAGGLLGLVMLAGVASADPSPAGPPVPPGQVGEDPVEAMRQIRVAELGWPTVRQHTREGDAMWWIIAKRLPTIREEEPSATYVDAVHYMAGGRLRRPRSARHYCMANLAPGEPVPAVCERWGWHRVPELDRHLEAIEARARSWLRGDVPDPCPRCIRWGMRDRESIDWRLARSYGWRLAPFGRRLAFWMRGAP